MSRMGAMQESSTDPGYRFEEFRFAAGSGELYRGNRRVPLRPQAALVLAALLRRPGDLVARRELQRMLWGDTAVDAEAGLNHCVRQVRRALGDSAAAPRFVVTEPRRGYRFVAAVQVVDAAGATTRAQRFLAPRHIAAGVMAAALLVAAGGFLLRGARPHAQPAGLGPRPSHAADAGVPAPVFPDYQRARYLLRQPGAEPAGRAVPLLERVARRAPGFAAGHAALARALLQSDPVSSGQRARRHVDRALELSPGLAEALLVQGEIHGLIDRDWRTAERDFRRAQQADPALVEALHHRAGVLALLGRHDEAIELMGRALALDPVSPLLTGDLAWFHFAARDWQGARDWARRTLELEPSWGTARSVLLHASARLGDLAEVRRQAAATLQEAGANPDVIAQIEVARDPLGPYWRWWDGRLAGAQDPATRVQRAFVHAALGRAEAALDDVEAAETAGYRFLPLLIGDPRLDALHGAPRYAALRERLGLPVGLSRAG